MATAFECELSDLLPLSVIAKQLPTRPRVGTVRKWHYYGRRNRHTNKMVYLKCVRLTGGLATTMDLYEQFIGELNEQQ